MPTTLQLPLLDGLVQGGIPYPSIVMVQFEPDSLWLETAATLAAQALRQGRPVDVHVFQKTPDEVKTALGALGVNVPAELEADRLRIIDSYTVQLGLGEIPATDRSDEFMARSVRLSDWSEAAKHQILAGSSESDQHRIHLDVNLTVLTRYNTESEIIDYWRTRMIPLIRSRGSILVSGLATGFAGESFYQQMASMSDVILEVKGTEVAGKMDHSFRVRTARGKVHDSNWQPLTLAENGEVSRAGAPTRAAEGSGLDAGHLLKVLDPEGTLQAFLASLTDLELSRYRVVGNYTRFDESTRQALKDFALRVAAGIAHPTAHHDNFLLWAPPGGGKTFLVHEVARSLGDGVDFQEVNLAQTDEAAFRASLERAALPARPTVVFVDEVDSKPSEPWPYEALLPILEPPSSPPHPVIFVLAGSSGGTVGEFAAAIRARPKGVDLLSRVPAENVLTLPAMTPEDRMLVALSNLETASHAEGHGISEIEKLALCYVALSPRLSNARQLREFILRGLERTPPGDDRFKFDNLFAAGDSESKEFWLGVRTANPQLVGRFVRIGG
jgi:KaiC/GvpD/RAD55 family RecA-like ATPase